MKPILQYPCSKRGLVTLAATAAILTSHLSAVQYDLTASGTQVLNVVGDYGGTAIVSDYLADSTGTGVFKPFLSIQRTPQEQGYNTDGFTNLFMDSTRPNWNSRLQLGDLGTVAIGGFNYFAFVLDANEPGGDKSLISVDNIRIYTSATDNTTAVGDDVSQLDNLGTLRWALNTPTTTTEMVDIIEKVKGKDVVVGQEEVDVFNTTNRIKLDSGQENTFNNASGGSGMADMVLFIPVAAFAGVSVSDYFWFYNLNGVQPGLYSEAGFEEWSAYTRGNPPPKVTLLNNNVPDASATLVLLSVGLGLVGLTARRSKKSSMN